MMGRVVFTKTAAGQREIERRGLRLTPHQRALLVMVDGRRNVDQLLSTLSSVGVTHEVVDELRERGLIASLSVVRVSAEAERNNPVSVLSASRAQGSSVAERVCKLNTVCAATIKEYLGEECARFEDKLRQASSLRDYLDLGNELIVLLDKRHGTPVARAFKAQIRPLIYGEEPALAAQRRS